LPHAGVVAYTLGVSSILAFGYDDPLRALATFVGAPTIGFGRLITQPTAHRGDWRRYRAMSCGARYVHILDDEPVEADGFEANRPDAEDLQEEPPELPIPSRGEAGWRLIPLLGFGHLGLALLF
ncbi:MAG: hypothetical protein OEY14_11710, partial [Myxococcales bacterium]|nr:hypothetical protein [Myxococcales bacterium]